jgi:hypothetical protein
MDPALAAVVAAIAGLCVGSFGSGLTRYAH